MLILNPDVKILFANGCSMTEGAEIGFDKFVAANRPTKRPPPYLTRYHQFMSDEHMAYMLDHAYPALLAKKLGLECINKGLGGSSNRRIVRTSIIELEKLKASYNPSQVFVVIGFTHSGRFELNIKGYGNLFVSVLPNGHPITEGANRDERRFADSRLDYYSESLFDLVADNLLNIICLQNYLKANGFEYLFTFGFGNSYDGYSDQEIQEVSLDKEMNTLFGVIDMSKFYTRHRIDNLHDFLVLEYKNSFHASCLEKNIITKAHQHPLEDGHAMWADTLLHTINNCNNP